MPPAIFAQSTEIANLLRKHPRVYLSQIAEASGLGDTKGLPQEGLPANVCLRWVTFGNCHYAACKRVHPATVDEAAAQTLFCAMLPGVNSIRAMTELPNQRKSK